MGLHVIEMPDRMLNYLHSRAIRTAFPLWYGWRPLGQHAALLEKTQWWSWPEIQALQMRKLDALLKHAYVNVPFYRRRFDEAGLQPGDIQTPADLICLPILTKREIQVHLQNLLARGINQRRLLENHTGGSTGQPLTFYQDANYEAWLLADLLRSHRMGGYKLGIRWAYLWGSDYDSKSHRGRWGRLRDRLVYNALWINTFDLTTETLIQAARQLVRWQPEMLVAYVSAATLLARLVIGRGIDGIRPQSIETSAEVLTPEDRQLLEKTFGCAVFDRYGCREVGNIAYECEAHRGLHILAENNLVEVVDENGQPTPPGTIGRIIVTNLNNFAMPFIRYEIGDMGVTAQYPCPCGRGLPQLQTIVGRRHDLITSPSGRLLPGGFFSHLFYQRSGIHQFRVIQETYTDLVVQIVPGPSFEQQASFKFLEEKIHHLGDPEFQIRFELHDHLPTNASGKYRFIVSQVPVSLK